MRLLLTVTVVHQAISPLPRVHHAAKASVMQSVWKRMNRFFCSLLIGGCLLPCSASGDEMDLLSVAKAVSSDVFPDFSYGSNEAQCQVNCVQFTGAVLERVLGRSLSREERSAVFIHYPITDFEQALKTGDQRMAGVARAIAEVLKVGNYVSPLEARAGDFIQYWVKRRDGRWFGHSAIVVRRIERKDGLAAVSIYGSHKATDGITETDFGGEGVLLEGDNRYVFVARLEGSASDLSASRSE